MYFFISQISPLWEGRGPSIEQIWIPLPKDALCQVWLKLALWFWRRRLLKVVNVLLFLHNYPSFTKVKAFYLNNLESPLRWKCGKFVMPTTRTTTMVNRQILISIQLIWDKKWAIGTENEEMKGQIVVALYAKMISCWGQK